MIDVVNCTNCPNWTLSKISLMPQLTIYFGSGQSLNFDLTDLLDYESEERCPVNFQFIYKKKAHPDLVEGITLGTTFFTRYSGLHYDFDNAKVAFSGSHTYKPIPTRSNGGPGVLAIVITSIVVGVGAIGLGIWIHKRKKL